MGEMVKDPNCAYCVEGELLAKFGYPCCEMKTGKLYVLQERKSDLSSQETCQRTDRTD